MNAVALEAVVIALVREVLWAVAIAVAAAVGVLVAVFACSSWS